MKKIATILILCLLLSPACLAESSADQFLSGLSDAWNGLVGMVSDAGNSISQWAEDSGIAPWARGAADDISKWAQENGLTDWANGALDEVNRWFADSGIAEWTAGASRDIQAFIDENRPGVEAWLNAAGEEVQRAWDTLVNPGQHTQEEVKEAYETVTESLGEMAGEQEAKP